MDGEALVLDKNGTTIAKLDIGCHFGEFVLFFER